MELKSTMQYEYRTVFHTNTSTALNKI